MPGLQIPCLTLRENTERPVTLESGSNMLIGRDMDLLRRSVDRNLAGDLRPSTVPELWDGRASQRIARVLATPKAHLTTSCIAQKELSSRE